MNINNVGNNHQIQNLANNPVRREIAPPATGTPTQPQDRVELSSTAAADALSRLKSGGDMRLDKVAAIKQQIADGSYEDDYKLDIATDRLLDDVLE